MYAPMPARPKKTNIVRTRTGCYTCRARHRKCDEAKPSCNRCIKYGVKCDGYKLRFSFFDTTTITSKRVEDTEAKKWAKIRDQDDSDNRSRKRKRTVSMVTSETDENTQRKGYIPVSGGRHRIWEAKGTWETTEASARASDLNGNSEEQFFTTHSPYNATSDPESVSPFTTNSSVMYTSPYASTIRKDWTHKPREPQPIPSSSSPNSGSSLASALLSPTSTSSESGPELEKRLEFEYLSHFNNRLSAILPRVFLDLTRSRSECLALRTAVLALAASNLAQGSEREIIRGRRTSKQHYSHLENGIKYYDSAIRLLAQLPMEDETLLETRLAATILFAYFESESGSPRGWFTHGSGADALVLARHESISRSPLGRQLLSCWAGLHARMEVHKLPFRPLELEQEKSSISSSTLTLRRLRHTFAVGSDAVFILLSDCLRMKTRIQLELCMRHNNEDTSVTLRRSISWYSRYFRYPFTTEAEKLGSHKYVPAEDLMKCLSFERAKLDSWHDTLSIDDLPIERYTIQTVEQTSSHMPYMASLQGDHPSTKHSSLILHPLQFRSNEAALKYIYYALAQLFSSPHLIQLVLSSPEKKSSGMPESHTQADNDVPSLVSPWAIIILRIISGLDAKELVFSGTYTIGILTILMKLLVCCPNLLVSHYILHTIFPRLENEITDGKFLLHLARQKRVFLKMDEEMRKGREPLLVHTNELADMESSDHVDSESEVWAAVHGRTKGNRGEFFNDFIKIG